MDGTERLSALRAELVKLVIHQETVFANWIRFAITVQGGLIAGLAFVLRETNYRVLGFLVAGFGFLTALLFARILHRHAQWLVWYVRTSTSLAPTSKIFPTRKGEVGELPVGTVTWSVIAFLLLVASAWIVIFIVVARTC
jgi:hypothetical protein